MDRRSKLSALALLMALLIGCEAPRKRVLPLPIPLTFADGMLSGFGSAIATPDAPCDPAQTRGAVEGPMLIDTATPLTTFRGPTAARVQLHEKGQILLGGRARTAARLFLCDVPLIETSQPTEHFSLAIGDAGINPMAILGGDRLREFSLLYSFGREVGEEQCDAPPCLTLLSSDIANNCQLSDRDEAVLPFRVVGGDLSVAIGDNILTYPPTRITLPVCLEPRSDPVDRTGRRASCFACERVERRAAELAFEIEASRAEPEKACRLRARLRYLKELCAPEPRLTCSAPGSRLPPPPLSPEDACGEIPTMEDVLEEERVRDARYEPSGLSGRLLVSSALPGMVLGRSAFAMLRGQQAADELFRAGPGAASVLKLPGFPPERAFRAQLGGAELSALALVSRERHLSPCAELARSRRQRYGLPQVLDAGRGCEQRCEQAACLRNADRTDMVRQRLCGYSGERSDLACNDALAPVAAVIEIAGPLAVLVVEDTAPVLRSANADIRSASPQVDGIIGIGLLSKLHAEIDYPSGRFIAHCACGQAGDACRTYRRFTTQMADACQRDLACLPLGAGLVGSAMCREER